MQRLRRNLIHEGKSWSLWLVRVRVGLETLLPLKEAWPGVGLGARPRIQ